MSRGIIELQECADCGLVFNATFDISLVQYDHSYDGRQEHSGIFRSHLESVAGGLVERYVNERPSSSVLDIGCGKGAFLRLMRDRGCVRCVGYDTSCPDALSADEGIEYHRRYVAVGDIQELFDLIVCRHVLCQVAKVGSFLRELANIARAAGGAVVAIETPTFEWIVENCSFWDVFYERCSYFTLATLATLCDQAGFEVLRHELVFGDQYQLIELRPSHSGTALSGGNGVLQQYSIGTHARQRELATSIATMRKGSRWAIWGAGGKGVTLSNSLGNEMLVGVIDSNPAKQGGYVPGVGAKVLSPDDPCIKDLGLVLIANSNYEHEIRTTLLASGYSGAILTV